MALLLKDINSHERDFHIVFEEQGHKYYIKKEPGYTSVTTLIHNAFPKFNADEVIDNMMKSPKWTESKYYGMTKEEIKKQWSSGNSNAASMGTAMHLMFEYYYNNIYQEKIDKYKDTIEYKYFTNFINDHEHFTPFRTEWNVYHEDYKIAGSIDMIFINNDGTLSIYDWKRCKKIEKYNNFGKRSIVKGLKHIHDTNYWHYTLQLNMYKYILEDKYGYTVKDLHLVVIHPDNEINNYEKIKLPFVQNEVQLLLKQKKTKISQYFK